MVQKHFIDIQNARFEDTELKESNIGAFQVGDIVQVTTKIDGSNSSFCYDTETGKLVAFSHRKQLDPMHTLNGFFNFIQSLNPDDFKSDHRLIPFGEWSIGCNKIKSYNTNLRKEWIVYDLYDREAERWLPQYCVIDYCKRHGFTYIEELYYGEFISWDHVFSLLHKSNAYGGTIQEGIVIKNQTKLNDENNRQPFYLKIVNDDFKEVAKTNRIKKLEDPNKLAEKAHCQEIVDAIVTRRRVEKGLEKLRDNGDIPEKLSPQDMSIVARLLPKYIYDDCVKEQEELVIEAGQYFGKACGTKVMSLAKEIILS